MRGVFALSAMLALVAVGTTRCDGETAVPGCDAAALQAALDAAAPGDTVRVGACRVTCSLTVPAGVTLAGEGRGTSVLVADAPYPAVRLTPGSAPARLVDLSVESGANSGVYVTGAGAAAVERVEIRATRGMAFAAQDVTTLMLTDVALAGPVTRETHVGWTDDPEETATHGLVLLRVSDATLHDVTATGFALFGALLVDGTTEWAGGGAPDNVGTGVMVYRGGADLRSLDLSGTLDGNRLMPAYGAVFAGDDTTEAQIATSGLHVSAGDDFGILHQRAATTHDGLVAEGNGSAAIWAQHCSSLHLRGATAVADNALGGVVGMDTQELVVDGATISTTSSIERTVSEGGRELVGDGIQVVSPPAGMTLDIRNTTFRTNERVGLLLELQGSSTAGVTLENVHVEDSAAGAYGVLAQGGTVDPGWASGVTRDTESVDSTAPSLGFMLLMGGAEFPAAERVASGSLVEIIEPDPPHRPRP